LALCGVMTYARGARVCAIATCPMHSAVQRKRRWRACMICSLVLSKSLPRALAGGVRSGTLPPCQACRSCSGECVGEPNENRPNYHGGTRIHRAVEDQLKYDVHDDPRATRLRIAATPLRSNSPRRPSTEEQPEQAGRISRLDVGKASANPQDDGDHRLQYEA
jgi:hypothetical protein